MNALPHSTVLTVGQRVITGGNEWEILSISLPTLRIKVHACDDLFSRYLGVGMTYEVRQHQRRSPNEEVWEIMPEHMKRSVSQVLLYVQNGSASIDMDM